MKLILFLVIVMMGNLAQAQTKDPLHLFDSTKRSATFDSVYKDVKGALATMADGLKITVDHLWGVLVYQQRLEAITWLIISGITLFPIIGFFRYYRKTISDGHGDLNKDGWIMVGLAGISFVLLIADCCNFSNIIQGLFNPEYGALKEIMKTME